MAETVELKDLVGKHVLSGVDYSHQSIEAEWGGGFEDCQVLNFILDGKGYSAIEDPEDGYRSTMRDLRVIDPALVTNTFPPIEVVAVYKVDGLGSYSYKSDLLEMYDTTNGKLVLRAGTDDTDDYYPIYVAEFTPENMSTNEAVE
jgi:hypothetical protein